MTDLSGADVVVLIPVLNRPRNAGPVAASVAAARNACQVRTLFLCTDGDVDELRAVKATGAQHVVLPGMRQPGDYARKMNLGHRLAADQQVPWVFLGADDLCFCDHWADAALACHNRTGAEVIGTNDLGNPRVMREQASTHTLVSTGYVGTPDRPDLLLTEAYAHNFVDVELVEYAKHRGAWAFARGSVVEHMHPAWRKSDSDDTYRLGNRDFGRDARLYQTRRRMWETKREVRVPRRRRRTAR